MVHIGRNDSLRQFHTQKMHPPPKGLIRPMAPPYPTYFEGAELQYEVQSWPCSPPPPPPPSLQAQDHIQIGRLSFVGQFLRPKAAGVN